MSHRIYAAPLLLALLVASGCAVSDQPPTEGPRAEKRGDCGPGQADSVPAARELMDAQVPSGTAAFRGAVDVCGIEEFEISVGREPELEEGRSTRMSASVFFTPTILVGDPGQEMTLSVAHDGRSRTHSFTIDQLDIDELIFSSEGDVVGTETKVRVEFPTDGKPLLFYCRFHRTGGMWGALVTH